MSEFIVNPTEQALQAIGAGKGMERIARMAEDMDGPEYDVELRAKGEEARPIFTVREMAWGDGSAFGIRHEEWEAWWPISFRTREQAERMLDQVLLDWLEGGESILVEGFCNLEDADA